MARTRLGHESGPGNANVAPYRRKGGVAGNKGREGLMSGLLKIRGYNTQRGRPASVVTLPEEVMRAFGWKPGMYLMFYPTTGRELVLVLQDQAMLHISPDYDLSLMPQGHEVGPRPGSIAERELDVTANMERLARKVAGKPPLPGDEEAEATADGAPSLDSAELDAEFELEPGDLEPKRKSGLTAAEWIMEKKRRRAAGEPLKKVREKGKGWAKSK